MVDVGGEPMGDICVMLCGVHVSARWNIGCNQVRAGLYQGLENVHEGDFHIGSQVGRHNASRKQGQLSDN